MCKISCLQVKSPTLGGADAAVHSSLMIAWSVTADSEHPNTNPSAYELSFQVLSANPSPQCCCHLTFHSHPVLVDLFVKSLAQHGRILPAIGSRRHNIPFMKPETHVVKEGKSNPVKHQFGIGHVTSVEADGQVTFNKICNRLRLQQKASSLIRRSTGTRAAS